MQKAKPFIEGTEDHDRKLSNKGIQRANNLASWLSKKNSYYSRAALLVIN